MIPIDISMIIINDHKVAYMESEALDKDTSFRVVFF